MTTRLFIIAITLGLAACATTFEQALQPVEIITPGAKNSKCDVYVQGVRHVVYPPQKITIAKSVEDLIIECRAPGNRYHKQVILPQETDIAFANMLWGGFGYMVDEATGAMYQYPDIITVDFTDTPYKAESLPAQNAPDVRQPETYDLEEFNAAQPRLNADKNAPVPELKARERNTIAEQNDSSKTAVTEGSGKDKADPPPGPPGSKTNPANAPVSLYPGQ